MRLPWFTRVLPARPWDGTDGGESILTASEASGATVATQGFTLALAPRAAATVHPD